MKGPGGDPLTPVRAALAAELRDPSSGNRPLILVCDACVDLLPIDGATVSVPDTVGTWETLYATDETAERIDALHDSLGEGPGFESSRHRRPVLVADLAADASPAWPVFATEAAALPIGAMFVLPLQAGATSLGTMLLYRRTSGWLAPGDLSIALRLVDLAVTALLALTDGGPGEHTLPHLPARREQVHQAAGMLIGAHGVSAGEALARLRGYAFITGAPVEQVADDIVARRLTPDTIIE